MPRGVNAYDEGRIQGRNVANANSSNIVSPGIVTDGLVLHLDAGNYQSYPIAGTTWYDLTDNRKNATLLNGPFYVRDGGGAIDFQTSTDYFEYPTPSFQFTTQPFSFDMVFYLTSLSTGSANAPVLVSNGRFNTYGYYFGFTGTTGPTGVSFLTNQTSAHQISESNAVFSVGEWSHLCITRVGSSVRIYRNGVDQTNIAATHIDPSTHSESFYFNTYRGNWFGNLTYPIFRIYNRALTPSEVAQNFNATRARFGI